MSEAKQTSRPHWAARADEWLNRRQQARLLRKGWRVRIVPHISFGNPRRVRLLARTILSRPDAERLPDPQELLLAHKAKDPNDEPIRYEPTRSQRGWRSFLTPAAMYCPVEVELGGKTQQLTSDRSGYLDVMLDVDLPPGWHKATLRQNGEAIEVPVVIIGDDVRVGIVSDIDDTVMVTSMPRLLIAGWNAFVRHENARRVVPGMPVLYHELRNQFPGAPIVYLSTGAWDVAPVLQRFLTVHGFPIGPLLLTDWGPTNTGLFRSGAQHKINNLRFLIELFPKIKWVLIGDDGQHDPELYGVIARQRPDHIKAILLRQLTPSQHVLAHGVPGVVELPESAVSVPVVKGQDGSALRALLKISDALGSDHRETEVRSGSAI